MSRIKAFSLSVVIAMAFLTAPAIAADKTAQDYINEAMEFLPFSCVGLVDHLENDQDKIENAIGLMFAVSVINRDIDVEAIIQTEEEGNQFRDDIAESIRLACEDDIDALMAGIVDQAVVKAFAE